MNHPSDCLYVGVDVHKENHTACVLDCFYQTLWEGQITNTHKGFQTLSNQIERLACQTQKKVFFGLEDSYGNGLLLAHYLVQNGQTIKVINPILVDRLRRKTPHPEKSDILDAKWVAEVLIRQGRIDKLPTYSLSSSTQIAQELRELNNDREYLVQEQTRLKNQLHHLLNLTYGSHYKKLFSNPFSQRALAYFTQHPSPQNLLSFHFPYSLELLANRMRRKTKRLLNISEELKTIQKEQAELVKKSGQKLESMNGCGLVLASMVLAEVKDINRFHSPSALAKYAGLCPRERSSGKFFRHQKTSSGNRRLNTAIHRIALSQIGRRGNNYAKSYFQRKVTEGKTKRQALTCLKRRLIDIVYMMLKNKTTYHYHQTAMLT